MYASNKLKAKTRNTRPTMTDQSHARETDINVIVERLAISGTLPQGKTPIYGDFSKLPTDLRSMIEMGRRMKALHRRLPDVLQGLTNEQLLALTPEQLAAKLTPPAPPAPDAKKE